MAFQLNDICEQTCDEDIREVITNLPKDLPETFKRALSRISKTSPGKVKIAKKVFQWVSAAKRPLYLEELHEAIAIEPCQPFFKAEKLVTDINQIVPFCRGLVTLDEEENVVQYAHHSVKQFLSSVSSSAPSDDFQMQLSQADLKAGEVCVTYLNFNDFKRQVAKFQIPKAPLEPRAILNASLSTIPGSKVSSSWSKLERLLYNRRESKFDTMAHLSHMADENDATKFQKLRVRYAFLAYASEYWLSHTVDFEESNTRTWSLWKHLLVTSNPLAQTPWTSDDWTWRTRPLAQYIVENNHCALVRLIESSKPNDFAQAEKLHLLSRALSLGYVRLFELLLGSLLGSSSVSSYNLTPHLFRAAANGHSESVRSLLKAGACVTAVYDDCKPEDAAALDEAICDGPDAMIRMLSEMRCGFRTQPSDRYRGLLRPLHLAASFGHQSVIEVLLEYGSEIDARTQHGQHTALHLAARHGHEPALQALLAAGADFEAINKEGFTALHLAAQYGHESMAQLLLNIGFHLNARTHLEKAAASGHLSVVELLLKSGADVCNITFGQKTALHFAAESGHLSVVELLLKSGADVFDKTFNMKTALHFAAESGHLSVVELLLKSGADVCNITFGQKTALHFAAESGHLSVVELLLKSGADVFDKTFNMKTALHFAAESGHLSVVELLLKSGADVCNITFGQKTALHFAAESGHLSVVELLLKSGADVSEEDINLKRALHFAAESGHLSVVELLLKSGADVCDKTSIKKTALHFAAESGHLSVVELLLKSGADVSEEDINLKRALHFAVQSSHLPMVELQPKNSADVQARDQRGPTALLEAVQYEAEPVDRESMARILLCSGADVEARDESGRTALIYAAESGLELVVQLLLDRNANVHTTTRLGPTALDVAKYHRHIRIVKLLEEHRRKSRFVQRMGSSLTAPTQS